MKGVPELDGCSFVFPICAGSEGFHWKLVLESPVNGLADGTPVETDTVYTQAGFGALDHSQVYVAAATQPAPRWVHYFRSAPGVPSVPDSLLLSVTRPIRLTRLEVQWAGTRRGAKGARPPGS